jgi:hypothetical protein
VAVCDCKSGQMKLETIFWSSNKTDLSVRTVCKYGYGIKDR